MNQSVVMSAPLERVKDVETWIKEYKRLKKLIRALTENSLRELRNQVPSRHQLLPPPDI